MLYLIAIYNQRGFCYHAYKLDCNQHELVDLVTSRSPVRAIADNDWGKPENCYWEVEDNTTGAFYIFKMGVDPDTAAPVWVPLVIREVNGNPEAYTITHAYQEGESNLELKLRGGQYYGVRDFHLREGDHARYRYEFRLLDADGEVYFYGRTNDTSSVAPLEEWGGHFGCTVIEYLNDDNEWEVL